MKFEKVILEARIDYIDKPFYFNSFRIKDKLIYSNEEFKVRGKSFKIYFSKDQQDRNLEHALKRAGERSSIANTLRAHLSNKSDQDYDYDIREASKSKIIEAVKQAVRKKMSQLGKYGVNAEKLYGGYAVWSYSLNGIIPIVIGQKSDYVVEEDDENFIVQVKSFFSSDSIPNVNDEINRSDPESDILNKLQGFSVTSGSNRETIPTERFIVESLSKNYNIKFTLIAVD